MNTINRLVHANPSTTSSVTQTGTREGVPNRPRIKLMDNTSKIDRIKSNIMSEVDDLLSTENYYAVQLKEFSKILLQLTTLNNYKRGKYRLLNGIILIRRKDG